MTEDPRCCGTGTCIIDEDGVCWCGQRWNGEEMCFPKAETSNNDPAHAAVDTKVNMNGHEGGAAGSAFTRNN